MNDKERKNLGRELREYADSLDEHVGIDDIYTSLRWLAIEIERGEWG